MGRPFPANIRREWSAYVVGLLLKLVGADWDMAWHFQRVKDATSPAHLTNMVGDVIIGVAFLLAWRRRTPERQGALNWIGASFGIVLLAVPLDQLWHFVFGIDLTTWSPTHLLLFSGTVVLCFGLVRLLLADLDWNPGATFRSLTPGLAGWLLLGFLLFNLLDSFAFPAVFQEYSVLGAWNVQHAETLYPITQDIRHFATTVHDQPYDDLPHALYPAYQLAIGVLTALFIRRVTGQPFLSVAVAVVYVAERFVSNQILYATGWPLAAIPYHQIAVALCVETAWFLRTSRAIRSTLGALMATATSYAIWRFSPAVTWTVPLDWATVPWTIFGCLVGATLGIIGGDAVLATERFWQLDPTPRVRAWAHVVARR